MLFSKAVKGFSAKARKGFPLERENDVLFLFLLYALRAKSEEQRDQKEVGKLRQLDRLRAIL